MKVVVGSNNPVKIEATKLAFEKVWPDEKFEVIGFDIESGVSAQPMSAEESLKGARNRAKMAFEKMKADFAVGAEGGLEEINGKWFDCGWIVVVDKKGNEGVGTSVRMETPIRFMEKVLKEGMEIGDIDDNFFKKKAKKNKQQK